MRKVFAIFCFLSLLAACHPKPVTPAPTPTPKTLVTATARASVTLSPRPTSTPSATRRANSVGTQTATPSPTATQLVLSGEAPPRQANAYVLKSWNGDEAWDLVVMEDPVLPERDGQRNSWQAWAKVEWTLLREIASRFADSPHHAEARAHLLSPAPYGAFDGDENSVEPFRQALEDALNAEHGLRISAESLNPVIARVLLLDDYDDYPFAEVFPAENVLADGAPGWILGLRVPGPGGAAMALSGGPGNYRLVSALENWRVFAWDEQKVFTGDLNANGIPEVVIRDSYWGTGMSHFCDEVLGVYEWDGRQFVNLTPGLVTSANTDSGDCLDFEFPREPNGLQSITTGNLIASGCYDDAAGDWYGVGSLVIRRHYRWNGAYFAAAGEEIEPLESILPAEWPLLNRCTLSWVNEAGVENDQAFGLLPTLVAQTEPLLTEEFTKQFGPAYLDYFRFKLGTWYALRGQRAPALALLAQVRDRPANAQFDMPSQLADAFLRAYTSTGLYAGCAAANGLLDIYQFYGMTGDLNTGDMEAAWGFSEIQWAYGHGNFFSGPSGRKDPLNVCSLGAAFRAAVENQRFSSSEQLIRWLDEQQVPHTGLEPGDVDGDGRSDWLVLLGTGEEQSWHLWVLLNQVGNTRPVWVGETGISAGRSNLPTTWHTFTPNPPDLPLNVYQWADGMFIFRLLPQGGETGVEMLDKSFQDAFLGFTALPVSGSGDAESPAAENLRVKVSDNAFWQNDWYVLGWDPAGNGLHLISSPQYDQDQKILAAESLLFEQGDPAGATEILQQLLSDENQLLDEAVERYDALPQVRPYLLYLLGLAYEMNAKQQIAATTYWTLWHDFPLHPLSYVVQQKLERK